MRLPLRLDVLLCLLALAACASGQVPAQVKTMAERLGYPADAKLLIIHADDLGVAHSVNQASFDAFERKAITSASVMVPCPWFTEVAAYAREHPDHDIGLHLTLNSEWKDFKWGPVASRSEVPGLLDPWGYFFPDVSSVVKNAKPEEVEREIRAQVELALKMGLKPTHLDSHMGTLFANPTFFAAYVKVAREYRLPFFMVDVRNLPPALAGMLPAELVTHLGEGDIILDAFISAHPLVKPEEWGAHYAGILKSLKPGVTQLIVHLGYDDAELRAVTVDHPDFGSAWRQRDLDVITSPEFKKLLEENRIILVGWKDLKKLVP